MIHLPLILLSICVLTILIVAFWPDKPTAIKATPSVSEDKAIQKAIREFERDNPRPDSYLELWSNLMCVTFDQEGRSFAATDIERHPDGSVTLSLRMIKVQHIIVYTVSSLSNGGTPTCYDIKYDEDYVHQNPIYERTFSPGTFAEYEVEYLTF